MQIAVLGALQNLSYGRANKENKLQITGEHGLPEIMLALRMSRVPEVSVCVMCVYVCVCVHMYVCMWCVCVCMCCMCVCVYACVCMRHSVYVCVC